MIILETKNLLKQYSGVSVVDHLNLRIQEGICFGLLGPNGAGKTTTIEMMEGIIRPTSGEIFFRGQPITRRTLESIGIQFQNTALPDYLKVKEVLTLFSRLYKKSSSIPDLIESCQLQEFSHRYTQELSGGQRQRLLLALGLINDPDLIFLDEPTTGLDPSARRDFWNLIHSIKKKKKTILLTTHYMDEAYQLCDEIAILNRGQVIAQGSPDLLLRNYFKGLSIRIPNEDLSLKPEQIRGIDQIFDRGESIEIQTTQIKETLQSLLDLNIPLDGIQIRSRNLEDLFLHLTGRGITE